jgi:hypothetical protein
VFAEYVALVKNLRGVVLLDAREDEAQRRVAWLGQRFRYRNLGVPPALVAAHPDFLDARLRGKPFVELAFPLASVERVAEAVVDFGETTRTTAEAMVLASVYASPLICLGPAALAAVRPFAVDAVETTLVLSDKDWRLHFRISDYAVLDLHHWSTDHARRLWRTTRTTSRKHDASASPKISGGTGGSSKATGLSSHSSSTSIWPSGPPGTALSAPPLPGCPRTKPALRSPS